MTRYRNVFSKERTLFPVIHTEKEEQALRNVNIAFEGGTDGVFLINHTISWERLLEIYWCVREAFPDFPIGINFLDLSPNSAFEHAPSDCFGIWSDEGHITNSQTELRALIAGWVRSHEQDEKRPLYFGGIAFKHQREVRDEGRAAELAIPYMDVVVTSGHTTGAPPTLQKIQKMKKAVGSYPLGNASGITLENVETYLPYVDTFLVATGISNSFTELDYEKVKELAKIIHR